MYTKLFTVLITILLVVSACQGGDNKTETKKEADHPDFVRYSILKKGFNCEIKEGEDLVIKTPEEFDTLWKKLNANISILPDEPEINFDNELVVASFMGEMPSTGYWINLDTVYATETNTIVQVTANTQPDPTSNIYQVPTQPFFIAIVEKNDLPVQFDFREADQ